MTGEVAHPLIAFLEGEADFDQQRYSARFVMLTGGSPTHRTEYFVVADQVYERLPLGWMAGTKPPGEIGSPLALPPLLGCLHDGDLAAYARDPAARRIPVERLVSGIESRGTYVLRGTRTEHYRVQFDAPAAAATVPDHPLAEMYRWESRRERRTSISGSRENACTSSRR